MGLNTASRKDKIAIITGANSGVGFETAVGIAEAGYDVVMACRSETRATTAKAEILKRVPDASLDIMLIDLGELASVHAFAEALRNKHGRLDLLINNAGILDYSGRKNDDGYDLQLATNHLGHFLLTTLLIDMMPDVPASRVISLSSIAHKNARIHFDDLNFDKTSDGGAAYGQSKLACLMFSDELNRRLQAADRKMLSVCAHPGGSDSGLFDDMSRARYALLKLLGPFISHSNEAAAKPTLHAALASDVKGGDYYGPQGLMDLKGPVGHAKRSDYAKDRDVAERLWTVSEDMVGKKMLL